MEPIYWLAAVAVFVVLEIITLGITSVWFAGGALVAFIAGALGAKDWLQIVLFLAVSIVLLVFTRPVVERHLNNSRARTNVDELIGKQAEVLEAIDGSNHFGRVSLNGMEWAARAAAEGEMIPQGAKVRVKEVKGAHLVVEVCN